MSSFVRLGIIKGFSHVTRIANRKVALTEYEKMLNGQWFNALDPALRDLRVLAKQRLAQLNNTTPEQIKLRRRLQLALFGSVGQQVFIEPPFFCDYGQHIHLGDKVFFNVNCVVLDVAPVRVGNNVFFGPAVQLYTVNHPLLAAERRSGQQRAFAITIADDVWLGGGVIVCPGVSIGARTVVAAGSVVTKDLPEDVLASGNPCQVIRKLDNGSASQQD